MVKPTYMLILRKQGKKPQIWFRTGKELVGHFMPNQLHLSKVSTGAKFINSLGRDFISHLPVLHEILGTHAAQSCSVLVWGHVAHNAMVVSPP